MLFLGGGRGVKHSVLCFGEVNISSFCVIYTFSEEMQTSGIIPKLRIQTNKILKEMTERKYLSEN